MSTPSQNPNDLIADAMARPKKMTLSGDSTEQHSLKELQDAQERVAATQSLKRAPFGLRFARARFPGAT